MADNDKRKEAAKFANSMRGQFIIGQALYRAAEVMKAEPDYKREDSNIADMEYLMKNLFPLYAITEGARIEAEKKSLTIKKDRIG